MSASLRWTYANCIRTCHLRVKEGTVVTSGERFPCHHASNLSGLCPAAETYPDEEILLEFSNGSQLSISLKPEEQQALKRLL